MQADHGEDIGLVVAVVDDDVAAQVHHRDHAAEARDRSDERGEHARPRDDLAEGRRRLIVAAAGVEMELTRDRLRVGADHEDEHEPDDHDPAGGEPGDDQGLGVELLPGEERPEDERAERRTEERAEEHVGDAACASRGRVHVGGCGPRQQDRPLGDADQREPEDDDRRGLETRSRAL